MKHAYAMTLPGLLLLTLGPLQAAPASAEVPVQAALDGLIKTHEVVSLTTRGGSRFLGRIVSGDHGQFIVQTFHYVTSSAAAPAAPPAAVPQPTAQPTSRRGRYGRSGSAMKQATPPAPPQPVQTVIADDVALRALLQGVGGPSFRPAEQAAAREIVAAADVQSLQTLSPPAVSPAPAHSGWTLKTLWPAPAQ